MFSFMLIIFKQFDFTVEMEFPNLDLSEDFIADTPPPDNRSQWRKATSGTENENIKVIYRFLIIYKY